MKAGKRAIAVLTAVLMLGITAMPAFAASEIKKDETVYVVTEADGDQNDVVVSDHLINGIATDKIPDRTNLNDIENVKGDETYEKGEGDDIIWDAQGNDIFYEGRTNKTVPVQLGISYFLNGEEVQGSGMEGASGEVKIIIHYRNTATASNGTTIPFLALTAFIAEDDCLTDIEIDHGKVIDDGDKQVVMALAVPGLNEALDIDSDIVDLDLEDTVTITGVAKDFSVQDMMTVVTSSIFEEIDQDDLEDLDYDDEIRQLNKGAKALMDGSDQLYRGIHTMYNKMPKLEDGVDALNDGAQKLSEGTDSAKEGAQKLAGGIGQLADALQNINKVLEQMYQAVAGMENGTSKIIKNLESMRDQLEQGSDDLADGADQLQPAVDGLNQGLPEVYQYLSTIEPVIKNNEKAIRTALKAKGYSDSQIDGLINGATSAKNAAGKMVSAAEGMKAAPAALDSASESLDKAADGLGSYDPSQGSDQKTIIGGLTVIDGGLDQLKDKIAAFSGGDMPDTSGLPALVNGANQLAQGEEQLASGARQLADGMQKLENKSTTLSNGVTQLNSGSLKLSNGMSKLYKDGIEKIVDLYNDDLKGNVDSIRDMIDAGQEYQTFTELADGMDGSVKFIYKTSVY